MELGEFIIKDNILQKYNGISKEVNIPIGVGIIGKEAFKGKNIEKINMPVTLHEIQKSAFEDCKYLTTVQLNDKLEKINKSAFKNCSSLESITIPNLITKISESCFEDCLSLKSINFVDNGINLSKICRGAFRNCHLTEIKIPSNVKTIGSEAFAYCNYLTEVEMSNKIEKIGDYCFANCIKLCKVNISEAVTVINQYTFKNCKSLKEINIPLNVGIIYQGAFTNCSSLDTLSIENPKVQIVYAFCGCDSLKNINASDFCEINSANK